MYIHIIKIVLSMTAILRGNSWPSSNSSETGKSWNVSTLLWPETRLSLRPHFTDVD